MKLKYQGSVSHGHKVLEFAEFLAHSVSSSKFLKSIPVRSEQELKQQQQSWKDRKTDNSSSSPCLNHIHNLHEDIIDRIVNREKQ